MKGKTIILVFVIQAIIGLTWFANGTITARFDDSLFPIIMQVAGMGWAILNSILTYACWHDLNNAIMIKEVDLLKDTSKKVEALEEEQNE